MTIFLSVLAVTFAAVCVWLAVRVVNRRERWAKWTAVVVALLVAYPLSYGPWLYVTARWGNNTWFAAATGWAFMPLSVASHNEPQWLTEPYRIYLSHCIYRGKRDRP